MRWEERGGREGGVSVGAGHAVCAAVCCRVVGGYLVVGVVVVAVAGSSSLNPTRSFFRLAAVSTTTRRGVQSARRPPPAPCENVPFSGGGVGVVVRAGGMAVASCVACSLSQRERLEPVVGGQESGERRTGEGDALRASLLPPPTRTQQRVLMPASQAKLSSW